MIIKKKKIKKQKFGEKDGEEREGNYCFEALGHKLLEVDHISWPISPSLAY